MHALDQTAIVDPPAGGSFGAAVRPRGPLSAWLCGLLSKGPENRAWPEPPPVPAYATEDLQLGLYLCYELHYRGLPGASDAWEWSPRLLDWRASLERVFEDGLIRAVGPIPAAHAHEIPGLLAGIAADDSGPSVSRFLKSSARREQFAEFLIHRSAYHLKEADPHSWAIPRLEGGPKAALVQIQSDEYGGGDSGWMHSALFARAMQGLGLDPTYGAYLDRIPGVTLATVNLMSFFGLHRRWRGALVGQLALFEMTSSIPNARYAAGLRRLGFGAPTTTFFDEHVEADAVHEQLAAHALAGTLAREEPALIESIIFGARALAATDARWSSHVLGAWGRGDTSLLPCR
jgi:Iron-containing redox enzyme